MRPRRSPSEEDILDSNSRPISYERGSSTFFFQIFEGKGFWSRLGSIDHHRASRSRFIIKIGSDDDDDDDDDDDSLE